MSAARSGRQRGRYVWFAGLALAMAAVTGCRHRTAYRPPPPTLPSGPSAETPGYPAPPGRGVRTAPESGVGEADLEFVATHKPILTEVGLATWYTDYKGRKQADGDPLDDDVMSAANRTLPLGSLVVVTNLKTGQSGAMHITDRGPFVEGRILDLSKASAKAVGVYRDGVDRVRLDVYRTPKSIWTGGRWCVQIGPFTSEHLADTLKKRLIRKYPRASVIDFAAERREYWVRIRPHDGDRETAVYLTRHVRPSQGVAFLTRLD